MACKPLLAELRAAPLAFRLPSGAAALTSSEAPAYFRDLTHALTKYLPGGGLSDMPMRQGSGKLRGVRARVRVRDFSA